MHQHFADAVIIIGIHRARVTDPKSASCACVPNEDPTYEKQTVLEILETLRYSHMDGCISSNTLCPKMPAAETFLCFKKGAGGMGRQPSDYV